MLELFEEVEKVLESTEYDLQFIVYGDPKSQGRPRATTKGKFATVYEDKKDKQNKATMAAIIQLKLPEDFQLFTGPLRVDLCFYFKRPKNHFGTGRNEGILKLSAPKHYTSKPDRDNLDKLTLDALTGILWKDDAAVCQGWLQKQYSDRPRTEIYIKKL